MIPVLRGDQSSAFLREGYRFGERRFARLGSDSFRARIALRPVVFLRGPEAAGFFYEGDRFTRAAALPPGVQHLLQDTGSVQRLEGREHAHRKAMFMGMMMPTAMEDVRRIFREEWADAVEGWRGYEIEFRRELPELLTRTVCRWAGVPLDEDEVEARSGELAAMFEYAGSFGPPNWAARIRRLRGEAWARGVIQEIRDGEYAPPPGSPVADIATHRGLEGEELRVQDAATELLNLLRPTVAVARFLVFAALALHHRPQWAERFAAGDETDLDGFVLEVRRHAPFFPAVAGTAARDLEWQGERLGQGAWVMLDLWATNHDPSVWEDPDDFRPERFRGRELRPNELVPQGAGFVEGGHRCPGEDLTTELIRETVRLLARDTRYVVPPQDLNVRMNRFPATPNSGLRLRVA